MRRSVLLVLPLIISTMGIKVPVDNVPIDSSESKPSDADSGHDNNQTQNKPIYYISDDPVDSYLIPPNPHRPEEVLPDSVVTPATFLLPPSENKQSDYYYAPTESDDQTDWYPIAQQPPQNQPILLLPPRQQNSAIPIFIASENQSESLKGVQNPRTGKVLGERPSIPTPSLKLEPPAEDAPNEYVIQIPSEQLELPAEEIDHPYLPIQGNHATYQPKAPHRIPSKSQLRKLKNPTKLYPKKFNGGFKPVPIPIGQFAEDSSLEVPKAKPLKYFKPLATTEDDQGPLDEKRIQLYEQDEQKHALKDSEEAQEQQNASSDRYPGVPPAEQDASETYRYPGRNVYAPVPIRGPPAPIRVAPNVVPAPRPENKPQPQAPPAPDDRTEFRMHGMKGPHSYQFGYDTGKGKNRQFRYEERDNDGLVRGHYGYMDKHGKLRVVNYSAHPEHGFQAHPQEENKEE